MGLQKILSRTIFLSLSFPDLKFVLVSGNGLRSGSVGHRLTQLQQLVVNLTQPVAETGKTGQERVEPGAGVLVATFLQLQSPPYPLPSPPHCLQLEGDEPAGDMEENQTLLVNLRNVSKFIQLQQSLTLDALIL